MARHKSSTWKSSWKACLRGQKRSFQTPTWAACCGRGDELLNISHVILFPDFVASRVKESDLGAFLAFAPTMNSEFRCSVRDVEERRRRWSQRHRQSPPWQWPLLARSSNPAAAARDIQPIEAGPSGAEARVNGRFLLELDFAQFGLFGLGVGKHDFGGRALKLGQAGHSCLHLNGFALVRVNQEITAATEAQALECSSSRRCLDRRQLNAGKVNLGQTPDDTGRERRLQPFLGQSLGWSFLPSRTTVIAPPTWLG